MRPSAAAYTNYVEEDVDSLFGDTRLSIQPYYEYTPPTLSGTQKEKFIKAVMELANKTDIDKYDYDFNKFFDAIAYETYLNVTNPVSEGNVTTPFDNDPLSGSSVAGVNNQSTADFHPEYNFGAGTAEHNMGEIVPTLIKLFKERYQTEPTAAQLNNLSLIVTAYAINAPVSEVGDIQALCSSVVNEFDICDMESDPISGMTYPESVSDPETAAVPFDVPTVFPEKPAAPAPRPQTPAQTNTRPQNPVQNEPEPQEVPTFDTYGTFSNSGSNSNASADTLKTAVKKIQNLTADSLKDKYEKYKKQIEAATRGMNKDS